MSLNIEGNTPPHAECLNHEEDVFIHFDGGYFVWNIRESLQGIWWNGDMFLLASWKFSEGKEAATAFNEWVKNVSILAAVLN